MALGTVILAAKTVTVVRDDKFSNRGPLPVCRFDHNCGINVLI